MSERLTPKREREIRGAMRDAPHCVAELLAELDALRRERDEMQAKLRKIAEEIAENREYTQCHYPVAADEDQGDCGDWPGCPDDCMYVRLRRLAGIEKQDERIGGAQ